jgi:DNA-binding NarL/FixJ family response regulator
MKSEPPAPKKAVAPIPPPATAAAGSAKPAPLVSVAVVEDDDRTRAILSEWINSSANFRCQHTYGDGEIAWQRLPLDRPDIVLMDINLPKVNGVECVRRLRPVVPSMQFVMLTVYEDVEHIFAALSAGAVGYLLKRSSPDELIGALNYVRTGGSPMTTLIARKVAQAFPLQAAPAPAEDDLSARERQVLELVARGYFYKEIAAELGITLNTVHTFIRRIYEKLHVRSRTEAISKYRQKG